MEVKIDGKAYPCEMTMGAMLRFNELTGKEVTDIADGDLSGMVRMIWCCVVSSCAAKKIPFDYGLQEFADAIDASAMLDISRALGAGSEAPASGKVKKK